MSWLCNCGLTNSGLNDSCAASRSSLLVFNTEHYQISSNTLDLLRTHVILKELQKEIQTRMTPEEELFAKWYSEEKILVKDMPDADLREHRATLSLIAKEARARVQAAEDEDRDRRAKNGNKQWLISNNDVSSSDAINAVKTRASRMSKMDKMRADLSKYLPDETVNEMIKNMERKATEKDMKVVTFKRTVTEDAAVVVNVNKPVAESKPFDFSSLDDIIKK